MIMNYMIRYWRGEGERTKRSEILLRRLLADRIRRERKERLYES